MHTVRAESRRIDRRKRRASALCDLLEGGVQRRKVLPVAYPDQRDACRTLCLQGIDLVFDGSKLCLCRVVADATRQDDRLAAHRIGWQRVDVAKHGVGRETFLRISSVATGPLNADCQTVADDERCGLGSLGGRLCRGSATKLALEPRDVLRHCADAVISVLDPRRRATRRSDVPRS